MLLPALPLAELIIYFLRRMKHTSNSMRVFDKSLIRKALSSVAMSLIFTFIDPQCVLLFFASTSCVVKWSAVQGNAVIKVVLPPVFILVVQVLSLTITPASAETRISIAGTGLTAAVMFHVQLASATPPTSYLLWSDKLMTAVYGVIVFNGLASIAMLRTKKWHLKDTMARHIFNWSEVSFMALQQTATALMLD